MTTFEGNTLNHLRFAIVSAPSTLRGYVTPYLGRAEDTQADTPMANNGVSNVMIYIKDSHEDHIIISLQLIPKKCVFEDKETCYVYLLH